MVNNVVNNVRGVAKSVAIGLLRANPWNPNKMDPAMYRKELASIRKFGFVDPITVRSVAGGFEIIDGEHRWRAARELGFAEIPIFSLGPMPDEDAKQLTIVLNETRGKAEPRKLGALLKDLLESESKSDLLDLLPYSPPVFDKLVGDMELEEWAQPALSPAASWVERTYRLPVEAAEVIDEAMAKAKDDEEIADWQALERIAADFLSGA